MIAFMLLTLAQPPAVADTVFFNGRVWTGDAAKPEVQAIAVKNGQIVAVGTDAEAKALAPNAKLIDLYGKRVVPGFYDSHVHFLGGGRSLAEVDLKDAKDEAEFGKRLKDWDAKLPKGRWIVGGNWDHDRAFNSVLPTAAIVDKYVKDRPVFISRYDGHMAVANSAAMKLAGVTAETKDVPGGVIFRDVNHQPTGVLKDNAMTLVDKSVPEPDDTEVNDAIRAAMNACLMNGVTSVEDMEGSSDGTYAKYRKALIALDDANQLNVRLSIHIPIAALGRQKAAKGLYHSPSLAILGVKGFMDGSLGSSTARMFEPFDSDAKTSGVYVTEPAVMRNLIMAADKEKMLIAVHAIGDQANSVLLDIYKEVAEANGPRDRRFRIEHAQHLKPSDYARFKELGVIASMQPYHVIDDGRWAEGRIGAKRCESSYAYRSLLDAGAMVAFGSDWPVAPLDVMAGIDAAVNRRTLDGKHPGGWFPQQRITVEEAVKCYTQGSAFAGFHEKDRGILKKQYVADFVVLSQDIFDPKLKDEIAKTKVEKTIMNGKVVFEISRK